MPAPQGHEPYPGCETGGRPKKYTKEFIEKEAEAFHKWMENPKNLWFEDFAFSRGYSARLLSLWAKDEENQKFSEAYERAQQWQKSLLIRGGLLKKFNFNMAQLLLGHCFGIVSKQETKVSGDALNPLSCLLNLIDGQTKDLIHDESSE